MLGVRHFTYSANIDKSSLKQGDIVTKSENLNSLLKKYHKHYINPEYTHFQILTQTCDLVRRGSAGECSTRYITLAAIRDLDIVIERYIKKFASKVIQGNDVVYCSDKYKAKLASTLSSLFNQNDKNFFFLKSSPVDGFANDSCTFMHLSIAIRANEHYDTCLDAKILELKESFRAKLGWMVGNLYSRVGTEDFVPGAMPDKHSFDDFISERLDNIVAWIPHDAFSEFKRVFDASLSSQDIIEKALQGLNEKREQRINTLLGQLRREAQLTTDQISSIRAFLDTQRGKQWVP